MPRSLRRTLASLVVLSSLAAGQAAAQAPPSVPVPPPAAEAGGTQPGAAGAAQPAPATPPPRPFVKVVTKGGQEYEGWLVSRSAETLVVDLSGGGQMTIPASSVASVVERKDVTVQAGGEVWPEDRNRTRYLQSPSAFMLRAGEGYFSQKELLFSEVAIGITDFLSASLGGAVPFWFVQDGFNVFGGVKLGASLGDLVHLAASTSIFYVPGADPDIAFGLLYGTVTVGTTNAHLSVSGGWPYALTTGGEDVGNMILIVSGNLRLSRTVALVTENWILLDSTAWDTTTPVIGSLAVRIFGERIAVDLGLLVIPETSFPPPWVGFTYNFGG